MKLMNPILSVLMSLSFCVVASAGGSEPGDKGLTCSTPADTKMSVNIETVLTQRHGVFSRKIKSIAVNGLDKAYLHLILPESTTFNADFAFDNQSSLPAEVYAARNSEHNIGFVLKANLKPVDPEKAELTSELILHRGAFLAILPLHCVGL